MKKIAVLGCSGSIGKTALNVLKRYKDDFQIVLLANGKKKDEIIRLAKEYGVKTFFCADGLLVQNGEERAFNSEYLNHPETYSDADIVINGIVGLAGLAPTIAVLQAGKILATANKESIVCAGEYIQKMRETLRSEIRPLDSEHSTLWQCMGDKNNVKRLLITASGGAFRDWDKSIIEKSKAKDALNHPNWSMGQKVTIDCATLVNKGMEIIEAKRLFNIQNVDAIWHKESIVHSLVEMKDGTLIAGLSTPDMTLPIQYALTYPERKENAIPLLDLMRQKTLTFGAIDEDKFPCFTLCKNIAGCGDYAGTVLNAANEVAVKKYLQDRIGFYDIYACIKTALLKFGTKGIITSIDEIYRIDREVREYIGERIGE